MKELENIDLYKRLEKLDKDFASQLKKTALKIKELINKKTTINFPNYTNHDMNHSFKLMNTMYELIKNNKKDFNALEIALMIYSALFHDLGMAISDDEIENIKNNNSKYLYNQNFELIKENNFNNEDLALQEVIRNAHGKIAYDLITGEYEKEFRLPNHESISFAENLAEICLSHTTDKSYVENLKTNTTKGENEYNTQFLAILLRLSDILDIDSTRTPLALFESINLNDFSKSEWQKNFTIDNIKKIFTVNDLKEIRLEGSCKDIKIHRKLLGYIKWIENELRLAVDLTANMEKKYHILLNTEVKNKIKPIGNTIPDLKLNMDYHAITNLLMGEAIYGSKDLGLRELLQNSIDAIMVKKDMFVIKNLSQKDTFTPIIEINIDEENNKFIIEDNGMGMNEYIIKNYFLNVGKSYYKSKDFLNYKHNYSPIGNFGIGFLSCFMLSNEVQVITKHFNSNKKYIIDLEKNSEYIAFKEEEDNSFESGTKIILDLENIKSIFGDSNFEISIENFIKKNILIDSFKIILNKKSIPANLTLNKSSQLTINLSNFFDNLEGKIYITKNENIYEPLKLHFNNSTMNYYFDGENISSIDSLSQLKIEDFVINHEIGYLCVNTDLSNSFNQFDENNFICIFINKKIFKLFDKTLRSSITTNNILSQSHLPLETPIFINKDGIEENILFFANKIKELDFLKNYINLSEEFLYSFNSFMKIKFLFDEEKNSIGIYKYDNFYYDDEEKPKIFLKNILLSKAYLDFLQCDLIKNINYIINIKNNKLNFNISRKELSVESNKELSNNIGKIIHEQALEKFKLETYEKNLLTKFLKNFYIKNI